MHLLVITFLNEYTNSFTFSIINMISTETMQITHIAQTTGIVIYRRLLLLSPPHPHTG